LEIQRRRSDCSGAAHSLDHFAISVPDLDEAERFYEAFGLEVRRSGDRLSLHTTGSEHRWATVVEQPGPKRLQYVALGVYEDDVPVFERRIADRRLAIAPHEASNGAGLWLAGPDGLAIQLIVADKVSPSAASIPTATVRRPDSGACPARSKAGRVHPRRLSHLLMFTRDVDASIAFYRNVLGLRLSDRSADIIAFLHGAHGSDHHLIALAKSDDGGLHHSSWDVGSVHEIGLGAELMRARGYTRGWGLGRHVLGSNYFHYVRDPWDSYAEYSFDIDFIGAEIDWPVADHPPEDSFYVWGPEPPADFVVNYERAGPGSGAARADAAPADAMPADAAPADAAQSAPARRQETEPSQAA
jgi:catechol 2,3-dioxygenase-like lactoylglutathione lyase family enzyme